jgi:hypothetical protein
VFALGQNAREFREAKDEGPWRAAAQLSEASAVEVRGACEVVAVEGDVAEAGLGPKRLVVSNGCGRS